MQSQAPCLLSAHLQALSSDPNFIRLSKGAYSLHCLHPDKEQLVRAPQPKKRKLEELGEHAGLWL